MVCLEFSAVSEWPQYTSTEGNQAWQSPNSIRRAFSFHLSHLQFIVFYPTTSRLATMKVSAVLVASFAFSLVQCSLYFVTNPQVTALGLYHQVSETGKDPCCCSRYPDSSKWNQPCDGDLDGSVCNTNEIPGPEPSGNAYFGDSHPIDRSGICYASGKGHTQMPVHLPVLQLPCRLQAVQGPG